jgi:prepilin-type N-terminal cleavage/methylation domain-containing protein
MKSARRQPGFTLLELILAMAMVAMLAASLYASLRMAFKARDTATRVIGPVRAVNVAMDMIGQDLENALPPNGILAGPFLGQPAGSADNPTQFDTLEFFCIGEGPNHPGPTGWGGIRKIDLGVTEAADGTPNVLVRHVTDNLLAQIVPEPAEEIICRGVKSFTLRYYDLTMGWQDLWDSTQMGDVLPVAVEVTMEVQWPPAKPGEALSQEPGYKMTRIYWLPCHKEADTSGGTGSTGTTGATQ